MAYLVRTLPRAERDMEAIFEYIRGLTSPPATKWFLGLIDAIEGLAEHPHRHPVTMEDPALRHLLYGNKPHVYRIIYSIGIAAQRVEIIHVRHHARDAFKTLGSPQGGDAD
jgi:toxin ParE1/3/4